MDIPGIADLTTAINKLTTVMTNKPGGGGGVNMPGLNLGADMFGDPAKFIALAEQAVKTTDAYKGMKLALGDTGAAAVNLTTSFGTLMVNQALLQESSKGLGKVFLNLANESYLTATAFNAGTGAGGEFNKQVIGLREELADLPGASEAVQTSMMGLFNTFADFAGPGGIQETEMRVAKTVAILSTLGASVEDQAGSVRTLRMGFRQNDEQIDNSLRQIHSLADALDLNLGTVMTNFNNQLPMFSLFGDKGVQAFTRLQAQAKSTNIEIDKLADLSEKFVTVESTAEMIGTLRQAIPGFDLDFDIMADAVEGNAPEVIKKVSDALSKVDFKSLGAGTKRLIEDTFSLSTPELNALAKGGIDEYNKLVQDAPLPDDPLLKLQAAYAANQADLQQAMLDSVAGIQGLAAEMDEFDKKAFKQTLNTLEEINNAGMKDGFMSKITEVYAGLGDAVTGQSAAVEKAFQDVLASDRAAREQFWNNARIQFDEGTGRNLADAMFKVVSQ